MCLTYNGKRVSIFISNILFRLCDEAHITVLNMRYYTRVKYTHEYAANTNKKPEFSSSGNITNICLLIPRVRAEIRTQAFPANGFALSSADSRAHGNSSTGRQC